MLRLPHGVVTTRARYDSRVADDGTADLGDLLMRAARTLRRRWREVLAPVGPLPAPGPRARRGRQAGRRPALRPRRGAAHRAALGDRGGRRPAGARPGRADARPRRPPGGDPPADRRGPADPRRGRRRPHRRPAELLRPALRRPTAPPCDPRGLTARGQIGGRWPSHTVGEGHRRDPVRRRPLTIALTRDRCSPPAARPAAGPGHRHARRHRRPRHRRAGHRHRRRGVGAGAARGGATPRPTTLATSGRCAARRTSTAAPTCPGWPRRPHRSPTPTPASASSTRRGR